MEPFIGQIMLFAGNFAPRGWAKCDGQLLDITSHSALFSILGTTYGGDGRTTFGLPDLRGRTPMHEGHGPGLSNRNLGQKGGEETVTLTVNQIPAHGHDVRCFEAQGSLGTPRGNFPAGDRAGADDVYSASSDQTMNSGMIAQSGGGAAHDNMQPFLALNYCIALTGIFPSRN
ncbi:MAG: tail fiber protein [Planctomycetota bacterium]